MKQALTALLILIAQLCSANMASPIREGTFSSSALSSRDIDILKERIYLKIDKEFNNAVYTVEYFIKSDSSGKQIPLLFHARDYKGDFRVWVDGHEVIISEIPDEYTSTKNTRLEKFSNYFRPAVRDGESETIVISWEENSGYIYNLNDLKYFEIDLAKGEHHIKVEYTGNVWTDNYGWVKEYSFRYSLSPAKKWKSFGSLEIIVDATAFNGELTCNLGKENSGRLDDEAVWRFSELPADYIMIIYKPKIGVFASTMICIGPAGITLFVALRLITLHLFFIRKYRRREPEKRFSWPVIAGSITVPLAILGCYVMSFEFIDYIIGNDAGRFHGYSFLVVFFYPVVLPVYWTAMWLADKVLKRKTLNAI